MNPMTIQTTIETFFSHLSRGHVNEAFMLVDDNVTWWVPEELPFSGTKTKSEYLSIVKGIQSAFPSGFTVDIKGVTIEGNKAAVEAESNGIHSNGKTYANKYHFLITIKDQKFIAVKEYMNTLHLARLIS
jgi:uncharacterized protein